MLTLVLADNLPLLFVGWEGVGVCSYLLIGFWFTEEANAIAGKKAFVVNRVGDAGFLLAMFLLFWNLGPGPHALGFEEIAARAARIDPATVAWIALLLFVGATGKSAQIPLFVWLPDAMAGPTPVSALIHAATMVTAGVYMIARLNFLYLLAPSIMEVVAAVGAGTAIFAASIGLLQNDIKKVLAYSTISQLGYMFLAVGVGAFGAGVFHLMTHAFFKGLLFLGSGSVIHGMGGEQDMRKMGGLRRRMPVTFATFAIGTVAIAGMPPLAGFFSKDAILAGAMASGNVWLWAIGVGAAGLTSFYMFRLLFMTFFGECRADEHTRHHIHESPPSMLIPLIVLAALSICGGWIGLPLHFLWGDVLGHFLAPVFGGHSLPHMSEMTEVVLMAISVGAAVGGFGLALFMYVLRPAIADRAAAAAPGLYALIGNKYYVHEIYEAAFVRTTLSAATRLWSWVDVGVIDATVNGTAAFVAANGRLWRRMQTGNVQHYAVSMLVGAVLLLGYYAWK
jgi:NADH-quinone oxidoreductase subunit L